ncbi:glutathione peroxidase [Selenomonas sp. GACV-9]|uniref:glutathione peroxidase n=1 Tax=Selenomonas sp. GACV-9 TaxID=3158782 RepID=UPI0008F3753F|nr:glutathione peroxidase [Selenomonas ruminantium]
MTFYDFELEDNHGRQISLSEFRGKVLLLVNTATHCGFTPQYKELERLYRQYNAQGLEIIDIPCNQFLEQAPEDDADIETFCTLNYNTSFLRMKKADVNGEHELPLYTYLKAKQRFKGFGTGPKAMAMSVLLRKMDWHYNEKPDIKWNFTKFLVDRQGNVVNRFEPTTSMKKLETRLVACLNSQA